jgi:hypothetical protein
MDFMQMKVFDQDLKLTVAGRSQHILQFGKQWFPV